MVLSDRTIREELNHGGIVIDPLNYADIQPASVDLHLDRHLLQFRDFSLIDVRQDLGNLTEPVEIQDPFPYILQPSQFLLASTIEYVEIADDIVARLEGKSSLGRLGLLIHATAGYVDPGFKGNLTLEICNVGQYPITLYYGMKISQISFLRLSTVADRPYGSEKLGSKYQGQIGPTATRSNQDFSPEHKRRTRSYQQGENRLKQWIQGGRFQGDISAFARELEIPVKTVEDWVYGRAVPNQKNQDKLFSLTQISIYNTRADGEQTSLLPTSET